MSRTVERMLVDSRMQNVHAGHLVASVGTCNPYALVANTFHSGTAPLEIDGTG